MSKSAQQRLEELKRKRAMRELQTGAFGTSQATTIGKKKQFTSQRSQSLHIIGANVETYEKEVQCILQNRAQSMDKLDKRLSLQQHEQDQQQQVDLLQPKEHKRRKDDHRKEHHDSQIVKPKELSQQQLQTLVKSKNFNDFFNRSSKFLEKVLHHGDGNMIELLLKDGIKSKNINDKALTIKNTYAHHHFTSNRVVTDLDWSTQTPQYFLASYSQNQQGNIKDHVGVVLIWTPQVESRPEFHCFCQSAVTSARFFPYANSTVIGGCYNGQLLIWDFREKQMPVQRSGASGLGHKYPVYSLNVVGTQIANNIISFSNDGTMCIWDIKQFSKPIKNSIQLTAPRQTKSTSGNTTASGKKTIPGTNISLNSSDRRQRKEEILSVSVTCCQFPFGDDNNYYFGSLNGAMYKNSIDNQSVENLVIYDHHQSAISSLSINNPSPQYQVLSGLILTSSFDWTVKLWSPNSNKQPLRTFQNSDDYIYDVQWNPSNPTIFLTANNDGSLDLFDLTKDLQQPIQNIKLSSNGQNKCRWNSNGSVVVTGDSQGNICLLGMNEKIRRMENARVEDLKMILTQNKEEL